MTFTVNIESVQVCLSNLGLHNVVDAQVFCNELEQQAAKSGIVQTIPPLPPFRWIAVLGRDLAEYVPPPSVTVSTAPNLDPKRIRQRRIMIGETTDLLNRQEAKITRAPITSPLLYYGKLRFICFSSITVFSSNREHNQVFKDSWCTWDWVAPHLCILASESLDENVKGGIDSSEPLPMNFLMWGSSSTIDTTVTIQPASQMPQKTTCFVFGRKFADLLKYHPPAVIDGDSHA